MRIRTFAAGIAVLAAAFAGTPAHAADPVVKTYIGVIGDLTLQCHTVAVGGACFPVEEGTFTATLNIEDAFNTRVGFRTDFVGADGVRIGTVTAACDSVTLRVPEGAVTMRVGLDGPIGGPARCATSLPNGAGTVGEITYTPGLAQ